MTIRSSWWLCRRYLFGAGPGRAQALRRMRGGVLGLALSLVPLVLVWQVADGMIGGISARFIETGTFHVRAYPPPEPDGVRISPETVAEAAAIPGVTWAGVEREGMALLSSRQESLGVTVRAVDPRVLAEPGFARYLELKAGTLDLSDPGAILVGEDAARTLKVEPGDRVRLVTGKSDGRSGFVPRVSSFTVAGVVSSGYQELDKLWVFIGLERGRQVLPADASQEFLALKVARPGALPNPLFADAGGSGDEAGLLARLADTLGPRWQPYTWFELQRGQYLSFLTTRNLLLVIMALIVLVASVNVSSAMIMLVLEKQQEIAILKSVGARPGGIALCFVLAGGLSGAAGALLGLAVGALAALRVNEIISLLETAANGLAWLGWQLGGQAAGRPFESITLLNPAFYLQRIPVELRFGDLAFIGGLAVALSMAASWFPARRAAGLRPLQVFRKV